MTLQYKILSMNYYSLLLEIKNQVLLFPHKPVLKSTDDLLASNFQVTLISCMHIKTSIYVASHLLLTPFLLRHQLHTLFPYPLV